MKCVSRPWSWKRMHTNPTLDGNESTVIAPYHVFFLSAGPIFTIPSSHHSGVNLLLQNPAKMTITRGCKAITRKTQTHTHTRSGINTNQFSEKIFVSVKNVTWANYHENNTRKRVNRSDGYRDDWPNSAWPTKRKPSKRQCYRNECTNEWEWKEYEVIEK